MVPNNDFSHDVLILGRGLAGVVLSEVLQHRGLNVGVIDVPMQGRASAVAAGVLNPVVLRRVVPSWRARSLLAMASSFYQRLEVEYNSVFFHDLELHRLLSSTDALAHWNSRMQDPEVSDLINIAASTNTDTLRPHAGSGSVNGAAWCDVPALLEAHRTRWAQLDRLLLMQVTTDDVQAKGVGWAIGPWSAPLLIHCTGAFAGVPGLVPVKGELLTIRAPRLRLQEMLHGGVFVLPTGNDGYIVGSTYAWDRVWEGPSTAGKEYLMNKLELMINTPYEVVTHQAGVRPTSRDRRPILGRLPGKPGHAIMNGLGSRGVMLAPWCAHHLADHLLNGEPLDPEVDLARFGQIER